MLQALYPQKWPGTYCIGGWVDPSGWLRQVQQISAQLGFDPWTVQPVASHYTDCAVPDHSSNENFLVVCMLIYMLMNVGGNNDDTSFLWAISQKLFGTMETYCWWMWDTGCIKRHIWLFGNIWSVCNKTAVCGNHSNKTNFYAEHYKITGEVLKFTIFM